MSSDNTIAILQTKDGFRVTHAQAIENIDYHANETGFNLRQLYLYFHDADFFLFKEDALKKASEIYDKIINDPYGCIVEYGIQPIDASNIEFPKECPPCCGNPNIIFKKGTLYCLNCEEYL